MRYLATILCALSLSGCATSLGHVSAAQQRIDAKCPPGTYKQYVRWGRTKVIDAWCVDPQLRR